MSDPDELLTTTQVAELLGVTVRRVKQLIHTGQLRPTRKLGNYNVFRRAAVEAFAATPRPRGRPPKRPAMAPAEVVGGP